MLPTPSTSHVSFDNVYEPAEDSFLFLDTLSQASEVEYLTERFDNKHVSRAPFVVEIGTGSGVILSFLASNGKTLLGREDVLTMGTDVNPFACKAAAATVDVNMSSAVKASRTDPGGFLGCVNGNLTSPFALHSVDLLVFNPPYVPSDAVPEQAAILERPGDSWHKVFERDSHLLALATDGGADGMEVTSKVLCDLKRILNPDAGVAYILLCAQNKPEKVKQIVHDWGSEWSVSTVGSSGKQGGWEKLQIIRIARAPLQAVR